MMAVAVMVVVEVVAMVVAEEEVVVVAPSSPNKINIDFWKRGGVIYHQLLIN